MKRIAVVLALAAALGCRQQVAEDQVAARVNRAVLTKQDFRDALPQGLADISALGKEDLVRQWINSELLYQEALKQGLQKDPKVAKQLKDIEREFLANQLIQREIIEKHTATEDDARAYFAQHQEEYQSELRLSQILVPSKEDADRIKAQLDKGADFAKLARESSRDSASKARGGDLVAYFRRGSGTIPMDFEEAVFALKSGDVSQPIKLPDGYRIIKVTEKRPALERAQFEDVREGLVYALNMDRKKKAYEQLVDRLKAGAKVESHPDRLN